MRNLDDNFEAFDTLERPSLQPEWRQAQYLLLPLHSSEIGPYHDFYLRYPVLVQYNSRGMNDLSWTAIHKHVRNIHFNMCC